MFSDLLESTLKHLIIALALLCWSSLSHAETSSECDLSTATNGMADTWADRFNLCEPTVNTFIEWRLRGSEFYGPHLLELSELEPAEQLQIISTVDSLTPSEDQLIQNLRLPELLLEQIIRETQEAGADDFFEVPGFQEALTDHRAQGNIGVRMVGYISEYSNSASIIALVEGGRISNLRLADAQGRLGDAQGRLVDAQGRLIDLEEQVRLAEELGRAIDDVYDSAQGLISATEETSD